MSAAMKLDAERALFEAEYGPRDGFSWRNEDGSYKIASLQLAWEIWQKRAALDTSTPPQGELSALPELPNPDACVVTSVGTARCHSADQMRAYGLLCRQSCDYILGRTYLLPDDLVALERFHECATDFDSGGHDVSKAAMARLREIGVVESKGFGRHQITSFGDYVLGRAAGADFKFPLKTFAEYNEDSRLAAMHPTTGGK